MSDILIVDDERDIRELISDILEDEGYTTRLAGNSDDAMSEVAAELTDEEMRELANWYAGVKLEIEAPE